MPSALLLSNAGSLVSWFGAAQTGQASLGQNLGGGPAGTSIMTALVQNDLHSHACEVQRITISYDLMHATAPSQWLRCSTDCTDSYSAHQLID